MATLFYEPSTRTRLSFESAMIRLGGSVISTENASEFSSAVKGETLEDTIRIVHSYADVIVLRHFSKGASEIASKISAVPIVNAGDGAGEHPTQALLDLFTICENKNINGLKIAMVGDLKFGRTIHSLLKLLSLYKDVEVKLVAPNLLGLPSSLKLELSQKGLHLEESENLKDSLFRSDVLYMTRVQKERFTSEKEYKKYFGKYILTKELARKMKKDAIIMHPLPRVNEIAPEVDKDPRAFYFMQAKNGLFVRMALLSWIFHKS